MSGAYLRNRAAGLKQLGQKWLAVLMTLALLMGNQVIMAPLPVQAATNTLHLKVIQANVATTVEITQYRYIINIDNSGTTEQRTPDDGCSPASPGYPDSCHWVSVAGVKSSSPIYASGNQDDFNGVTGSGLDLPDGRYLISVLADGYKLDGTHFSMPLQNDGTVVVQMQGGDLPDATVQAAVFEDMAPTNSAPDLPAERGLAGFVGHISDYIGEVTTDVYGSPLCGNGLCESKCYVVDGGLDIGTVSPVDTAGRCPVAFTTAGDPLLSADITSTLEGTLISSLASPVIEGKVKIPNLGPNRYALSVTPPNNSNWIQTTTLEGNHDWDAWVMEGATGLDTEFAVAGEPFPATFFGYVLPANTMGAGSGTITGTALAVSAYIPPTGGITGELGLQGAKPKDKNPIKRLFVSLSDINNNDRTVYVGEFNCDLATGCGPVQFSIPNVPDGDYFLGVWDEPQDYIFNEQNVSVKNGEVVNLGSISMLGWWTTIEGYVFNDLNANGKKDAGEPGIPNFPIVMRTRENSIMDRGATTVTTDGNGYYWMENAYPMTQWLVEEAYADGFQTTGITYQADNQPAETTVLGSGVDVNLHPVIGLGGRLDWGVRAYPRGTNGGIVGTVSYDTTRNELDPAYAAIENWQPSISGLNVDLYAPVVCGTNPGTPCNATGLYELNPDGSYATGLLLNQYVTETWERPRGCVARKVDGTPLINGVDEQALPLGSDTPGNTEPCLEAPMMGVQFGPMSDGTTFGASVDGNYGFTDFCAAGVKTDAGGNVVWGVDGAPECADNAPHTAQMTANRDYIVKVEIPNDALGRPMYQVTKEEDINIANGDSFVPQAPPPACVGALHTVDLGGFGTDNYPAVVGDGGLTNSLPVGVTVPASSPVDNPSFVGIGGTIYEGQPKALCDAKLVRVSDRRSIAPGFNLFTDVPVPGRFWGLLVDDLNFSSNPRSLSYGEKMGIPFAPVGIYDYTNRLVYTAESDYNGLFDVLLPSTNRISCPTPSGVCANLYRFVGNDPGIPGRWNPNYTPQYRSISAEFEAFPGLTIPADLAPTQVAVAVQIPGTQTLSPISCNLDAATPQLFTISKPYMNAGDSLANRTFTLTGLGFGAQGSSSQVTLDGVAMTVNTWDDRSISFTVPTGVVPSGPHQLKAQANNRQTTINGLTFHILDASYNPTVFEVGPGTAYTYHTIQSALEAAASVSKALVVVYPAAPASSDPASPLYNPRYNGRGAYYENIVIHSPVKLQGVGPGGLYPDGTPVTGSIIDGIAYGGDTQVANDWRALVGTLTWDGNQDVSEGQVIYVLAHDGQFTSGYQAAIDGMDIRGGDQMGFPGNLNAIFGGFPGPIQAVNVETQGGAIFANAYARYLQITNNIIDSNGGAYGAIRIGTPNIPAPDSDQQNDNIRIANNRILANGGTNLAGAIGLFNGAENYEVASNDLCGNFSAEYGGAISHFGFSPNGSIHDNRIYFNRSYDEGAGIMIAGELAINPNASYGQTGGPQGSGPVNIFNNLIQANLSDDDGGGLRFLMAGNFPMNVYNNMIVNNVSTHEGGGVAIDDAPDVRFFNNTVMNNVTTATAITSDGLPAPAGLSTGANSGQLQAVLPGGAPAISEPLLFNNLFWDNRAGTRGTNTVTGITPTDADPWDMGVIGTAGSLLSPTNSVLQASVHPGVIASPTNLIANPNIVQALEIPLTFTSWRTNVNFTGAIMVTAGLPPNLAGNYHLFDVTSPAYNRGAASKNTISAPSFDIDRQGRPAFGAFDIGADEIPAANADLSVTKTDGQATAPRGLPITYTITVNNLGPDGITGATVVDTLPASITGAGWTCSATAGSTCPAPSGTGSLNTTVNLLNGGSATFTVTGLLNASTPIGSTVSNTAVVGVGASGVMDPIATNNSATDTDTVRAPQSNLSITKTDGVALINPGATVVYTIVATNAGPDQVIGAAVTDNLPSSLNVTGWTCSATAGSSCTAGGSGNNRSGSVNLLNGGSATYTATATLSSTASGVLLNIASINAPSGTIDPNPLNNNAADLDAIRMFMHVGDLDRASNNTSGTAWQAQVTVTVHSPSHSPVALAQVFFSWTGGGSGGASCITNAAGTCTVTRTGLSRASTPSVIATVTNITRINSVYQSGLNHDPDSGAQASNGTTITVLRP